MKYGKKGGKYIGKESKGGWEKKRGRDRGREREG